MRQKTIQSVSPTVKKSKPEEQEPLRLNKTKEKDLSFVVKGSDEEKKIKQELVRKIDAIDLNYAKFNLSEFSYKSVGVANPNEVSQEDTFNRMYALSIFTQLGETILNSNGDANSLVECMGMYMAFAMMSKVGRHPLKYLKEPKPIQQELYAMNPTYADQVANAMGNEDRRLPMTAECASLLYIKATQDAYEDMRKPGADAIAVKHDYDVYLKYLASRCEQDGISKKTLHRTTKQIYALFEEDDALNSCKLFEQTAGTFGVKERPYIMDSPYVDENNKPCIAAAHVHMGEYVYPDDTVARDSKFFNIRLPKSMDDYQKLMDIDASYLYMVHQTATITDNQEMLDVCQSEMRRVIDNYSVLMKDDNLIKGSEEEIREQVGNLLERALQDCHKEYESMDADSYREWKTSLCSMIDNYGELDEASGIYKDFDVNGAMKTIRNHVYDTSMTIYPRLSAQAIEEMADGRYEKRLSNNKNNKNNSSIAKSRFKKFGFPIGSGYEPQAEVAATGEDVRPSKQKKNENDFTEEELDELDLSQFDDVDFDAGDYDFC